MSIKERLIIEALREREHSDRMLEIVEQHPRFQPRVRMFSADDDGRSALIVLKPECQGGGLQTTCTFLRGMGFEFGQIRQFFYGVSGYLRVYGEVIREHPDSFVQILPALLDLNMRCPSWAITVNLPQGMALGRFKDEVIGGGPNPLDGSLRTRLKPLIERNGFLSLRDGLPALIDPGGQLALRSPDQNWRTFNGVHCPRTAEGLKCLHDVIVKGSLLTRP